MMFVDAVSFGVSQWISCCFSSLPVKSFGVIYCFSLRGPSNTNSYQFIRRKLLHFWQVASQSDTGAMVLACAKGLSHLCQWILPVRDETYLVADRKDYKVLRRCLLVGGLEHFLFSLYWDHIFFRGVGLPPTSLTVDLNVVRSHSTESPRYRGAKKSHKNLCPRY